MKKSDWAMIVLIIAVVGTISYFVIGSFLPAPVSETVKTAPSITADIEAPENNVILYDDSRPGWCAPSSTATDEETDATEVIAGKQYINSAFNACEINSSFTTTTE
jgi:hypothetical protein